MTYDERRIFHAIDLDRTLLNTPKLSSWMLDELQSSEPEFAEELRGREAEAQQNGDSSPVYASIQERLGARGLAQVRGAVAGRQTEELLLPGARNRLAYARSRPGWSGGIITYGEPEVQNWKLGLLGLEDEPHLVVATRRKGALIASWVLDDGRIQLPEEFCGGIVDTVVLDDDRAVAFENLPDFCYGNWIHEKDPVTEADLPPSVRRVDDLHEAIYRLETIL